MYVVGVDLSGPAGIDNTGVVVFSARDAGLDFVDQQCDGSDASLYSLIDALSCESPVVVGIDAPLSYEPGGGQRARDAELRRQIVAKGMRSGSVMAPTAPRMVYLTLRGIVLAQVLGALHAEPQVRIVEVHPGASLCLRDAPLDAILAFAADELARERLIDWLSSQRIDRLKVPAPCPSHFVAACAAAVAAWDWHFGRSRWLAKARLPWHPYDFAC
jgi:uncharacterized protein